MQLTKAFVFLFLLFVVNCDYYWYEGNSIQYSYLPTTSLGTFEGSYTSNSHLGFGLNICQDGTTIYGSYDQLGIFNGNVSTSNVATGSFYQAGTTTCSTGTFQLTLTTDGFTGTYTCQNKGSSKFNWTETKLSPFRPADDDCAIMDLSSPLTLSGRFVDAYGLAKDFCYDSSKNNASISFLYLDSNNVVQKGYFSGTEYSKGKIFLGTWFVLTPLAGADLYYLDDVGAVHSFYWTGLNGTSGTTLINPGQYNQPQYHNTRYYTGPITQTSSPNCDNYATIKTKVLNNLSPYGGEDDGYYFVSSAFDFAADDDGVDDDGANDDDYLYFNAGSHLHWFLLPLLLAVFF